MALKGRMSRMMLGASFLALDLSLFLQLNVPIKQQGDLYFRSPTTLAEHPQLIEASQTDVLRAVKIDDSISLSVIQQPEGTPTYVSPNAGELTQFSSASQYGNIGLLAHNYLSGKVFFHLKVGNEIQLEYDDGRTEKFVVSEILRYQALEPRSPFSSFKNLSNTDEVLSTSQMLERAYGGDRHITMQTCIAKYGISSWGRIFVVAIPKVESVEQLR